MQFSTGKWAPKLSACQPCAGQRHRNSMLGRAFLSPLMVCALAACIACTNQNPDQIRQKTAEETAAVKRDTKAIAQGLKEGLSNKRSIDLNKASRQDLESLPGVNAHQAERIIAERPY